jgi:hypothetical protein
MEKSRSVIVFSILKSGIGKFGKLHAKAQKGIKGAK